MSEFTIAQLLGHLRVGETTVSEVVAHHLDRIHTLDPSLNAVVTLSPAAMDDATRLDAAPTPHGLLHGVPLLVKDNIETAGIATAFGSAALADHFPATDAHLVTLLSDAGAIVLLARALLALGHHRQSP
ncbi:amidase family protein [Actinacidiphila glaucinigra]|uniref:amidase family protein n=1 Tax=Actinacidiphila glaucinigra TaxID=235986 RepID=UPI00366E3274